VRFTVVTLCICCVVCALTCIMLPYDSRRHYKVLLCFLLHRTATLPSKVLQHGKLTRTFCLALSLILRGTKSTEFGLNCWVAFWVALVWKLATCRK